MNPMYVSIAVVVVTVIGVLWYVYFKPVTFEDEVRELGSEYTTAEDLGTKGHTFVRGHAKVLSTYISPEDGSCVSILLRMDKHHTFDVYIVSGFNKKIDEYMRLVKSRKDACEYDVVFAKVRDRWVLFEINL